MQYQKSDSLISLPISSENSLGIGKHSSSQGQRQVFQNSILFMKAQILSLLVVFLVMTVSFLSFLRKCSPNTQVWIIIVQVNRCYSIKTQIVQFVIQLHKSFSPQNHLNSVCRSGWWKHPISSNMWKDIFKGWDFIKLVISLL